MKNYFCGVSVSSSNSVGIGVFSRLLSKVSRETDNYLIFVETFCIAYPVTPGLLDKTMNYLSSGRTIQDVHSDKKIFFLLF